jgi:hypothetical protein
VNIPLIILLLLSQVGSGGCFKFGAAMEQNDTLQVLDLSENGSLPMETLARIQQQCAVNMAQYEALYGTCDQWCDP